MNWSYLEQSILLIVDLLSCVIPRRTVHRVAAVPCRVLWWIVCKKTMSSLDDLFQLCIHIWDMLIERLIFVYSIFTTFKIILIHTLYFFGGVYPTASSLSSVSSSPLLPPGVIQHELHLANPGGDYYWKGGQPCIYIYIHYIYTCVYIYIQPTRL